MHVCFTALRFVQHDKVRIANLTLLSFALQKKRDVSAAPKQGEVKLGGNGESQVDFDGKKALL